MRQKQSETVNNIYKFCKKLCFMMQKASYYTPKHYVFTFKNKSFSYQKTAYYNCFTSVSIAHSPTFSHSSL